MQLALTQLATAQLCGGLRSRVCPAAQSTCKSLCVLSCCGITSWLLKIRPLFYVPLLCCLRFIVWPVKTKHPNVAACMYSEWRRGRSAALAQDLL